MSGAESSEALKMRYDSAVSRAESWLAENNRPQTWLAEQLDVEKSVLSRFLRGEQRYTPSPSRRKMLAILEGIERICHEESRDVFLSHRSSDKAFVRKLANDLESSNYGDRKLRVWLDEAEIRPGQSIPAMVGKGIESSSFVALVMTPDYFEGGSGWTDAEWHAAIHSDPDNRRARLLPLLVGDCPYIPSLLRHLLMIDFRDKKYADGLEQLLRVLRNEPLPRPIAFRGQLIESNGTIGRETLLAERAVPEADPDVFAERLFCNLLPVERFPKSIYYAPIANSLLKKSSTGELRFPNKKTLCDEIAKYHEKKGGKPWTPAFRLDREGIVTFHDLEVEGPLDAIIDTSSVEEFDTSEFLLDPDDRNLVVSLMNMAISRHLYRLGLRSDKDHLQRFFFTPDDGNERCIEWVPAKKKAKRTVTKPYSRNGVQDGWMHHACYIKTMFLASRLYIQLAPTRILTSDGETVRRGPDVGRVVVKWLGQERNLHVLYNVRFWTSILGGRRGPIGISAGDQRIEVAKVPAVVQQAYGIRGDQRDLMGLLDKEAERISRLENELPEAYDDQNESDEWDDI